MLIVANYRFMKKAVFLLLLSAGFGFAQNKNVDSLKLVLSKTTDPKERFNIINEILITTDGYQGTELDTTACLTLLKIAQQQKDDAMLATSYNWIGYYFQQSRGDNTAALDYYFKGLPLAEKVGDKRRISSLCFDIANIYSVFKQRGSLSVRAARRKKPAREKRVDVPLHARAIPARKSQLFRL